jgi:excisionase family DNA binding protein
MAQQKFIDLSEAADQLGIEQEYLNRLREQGELRGYRDGSSWKFRVDEIEKLAAKGLQEAGQHQGDDEPLNVDFEDLEIAAAEDPAVDDISFAGLDDPTVPADSKIVDNGLESLESGLVGDDDDDESVLLSETEFGDSENRPPSTIIGKVDLDLGSDTDLVLELGEDAAGQSDVRLATDSDILSSGAAAIPISTDPDTSGSKFEQIDELEIDLEAESSRILSPRDVVQAQQAAEAEAAGGSSVQVTENSDFDLAGPEESHSLGEISSVHIGDGSEKSSEAGLSGLSQLHIGDDSHASLTGLSRLELEADEEDVLSEENDFALSSQDSGINLTSPSDSGLALDDGPIDLGGSAIGSAIGLDSGLDIGDESIGFAAATDGSAGSEGADEFLLTADTESGIADDDSSSQIIALDEVVDSEEIGAAVFDDVMASDAMLDDPRLGDDDIGRPVSGSTEASFSLGSVLGLAGCVVLLCLGGIMMFDLVRNIWSWNKTYSLNSSLIESILSLFPS